MDQIFNKQAAWVTGAASGIGKAIAMRLAQQGAIVLAIDCDGDGLQALESEHGFHTHQCDVSNADSVNNIVDIVPADFRSPQIVVNAAGIYRAEPLAEHSDDTWNQVLSINLNGPFHVTRATLPGMMARGYGRLINISSGSGIKLSPQVAAYGSSKAAVIALTKAAALESAANGVTANIVAPGLVDTPMTRTALGKEGLQEIAKNSDIANPMALVMTPEDIAQAVAFLADPKSRAITGQVIHVNAGNLMP